MEQVQKILNNLLYYAFCQKLFPGSKVYRISKISSLVKIIKTERQVTESFYDFLPVFPVDISLTKTT